MTVGDFKAQFSSVLDKVLEGDDVQILYGRSKKPVAQLSKVEEKPKMNKRPLGCYKDCGPFWEDENFKLSSENLFDDMNDLMR